jgi:hypothetical protein
MPSKKALLPLGDRMPTTGIPKTSILDRHREPLASPQAITGRVCGLCGSRETGGAVNISDQFILEAML